MKKNIMIFLSVIFIFMISLTKAKAYDNSNVYIDYNNIDFLSYIESIQEQIDYVINDCDILYDDYMVRLNVIDTNNTTGQLLVCYELNNQQTYNLGFYSNRSGYTTSLKFTNNGTINRRHYINNPGYDFPFDIGTATSSSDINFYSIPNTTSKPYSSIDYFDSYLDISNLSFSLSGYILLYSTLDLHYNNYNEYTSHLYVNSVEIGHGDVIPLPFSQVEDPPEINFIAKYNIYHTRMSLLIDIESNIYTNQYSYDGLTWIDIPPNSSMTLYFEKNGFIIARIYDSERDKIINSATFNITQIQTFYNELDEINNKFDNEDLTNPTGFMQMINTFTTDIGDSVAVITILSTYTWNSLNGYIKYFILSIGFIVLIVALIKLFLKGK